MMIILKRFILCLVFLQMTSFVKAKHEYDRSWNLKIPPSVETPFKLIGRDCTRTSNTSDATFDLCVMRAVATYLRHHVVISDCLFGGETGTVKDMCMAARPGQRTKWKKCGSILDAFYNRKNCATKPLNSNNGFPIGYVPDHAAAEAEAAAGLRASNAARNILKTIISNQAAVCASIASAGFAALKIAGLRGNLQVVEESYGEGLGHVYLLYNKANGGSPRYPCGKARGEKKTASCGARYLDFWYHGLSSDPERELEGYLNFVPDRRPTVHKQAGLGFYKPATAPKSAAELTPKRGRANANRRVGQGLRANAAAMIANANRRGGIQVVRPATGTRVRTSPAASTEQARIARIKRDCPCSTACTVKAIASDMWCFVKAKSAACSAHVATPNTNAKDYKVYSFIRGSFRRCDEGEPVVP